MASKRAIKWAKEICKKYEVTHRFIKGNKSYALALPSQNHIIVPKDWPDLLFLSGVFHEIAHCLNYRDKKYYRYHKGNVSNKYMLRMALRAEVYTEQRAKKLARENGLLNYYVFYRFDKRSRDMIKGYYGL